MASATTTIEASQGRDRWRVLLVLLLLGAWFLRWTGTRTAVATGPDRTGVVAATALLLLWGLALTLLVAGRPGSMRRGVALTDAGLSIVAGILLLLGHAWIGGGVLRPVLAPIFLPLGLLALLDALAPEARRDDAVSMIRAVAALSAAAFVLNRGAMWPGFILLWLAFSPVLMLLAARTRLGARWGVDVLLLVASSAAFFAPELNAALGGVERASGIYEGRFAWQVLAAALALLSLVGVLWPSRSRGASA